MNTVPWQTFQAHSPKHETIGKIILQYLCTGSATTALIQLVSLTRQNGYNGAMEMD